MESNKGPRVNHESHDVKRNRFEQRLNALHYPLFFILTLSALWTLFTPTVEQSDSLWQSQQLAVLLHLVVGIIWTPLMVLYLLYHGFRFLGYRRLTVSLSGLALTLAVGLLVYSGFVLTTDHRFIEQGAIIDWHTLSAIAVWVLLLLHLIAHRWTLKSRRRTQSVKFKTLSQRLLWRSGLTTFILVMGAGYLLLLWGRQGLVQAPLSEQPAVTPYEKPYGDHPFRPSQTETPNSHFVHIQSISGSETCGTCHPAIVEQWQSSLHRRAANDQAYEKNIDLLVKKKGMAAARYCEGCHAPIALLTGELTTGGQHGGVDHTPANDEGISCLSCHGIDQVVHLKGVASYHFTPRKDYLFSHQDSEIARRLNQLLVNTYPFQHQQDLNRPLLKNPQYCATCHAQFMDETLNHWGWVPLQNDYAAWLKSPFSGQSHASVTSSEAVTCQDCHMPRVDADDPAADEQGQVASHHFFAANTAIPFLNGEKKQLEGTIHFLQDNKINIAIEKPRRQQGVHSAMALDEKSRKLNPAYFYVNETVEINVVVSSSGIGHDFPAGTTDINQAWIEFTAVDGQGRTISTSGHVNPDDTVDRDAYFYQSIPVDKRGNPVWKHDLFNKVGEAYRNVVSPRDGDVVEYRFTVPAWAETPITMMVRLRYRKFNNRYARWVLDDAYQPLPIVDMARDFLVVPVRVQQEVTAVRP